MKNTMNLVVVLLVLAVFMLGYGVVTQEPRILRLEQRVQALPQPADTPTALATPFSGADAVELYHLVNAYRVENGLQPLQVNAPLEQSAKMKLYDMLLNDYWAHNDKQGRPPWRFFIAAGYRYVWADENLAQGYPTPKEVVAGWKASPEHNKNLLDPNVTDTGFASMCGVSFQGYDDTCVVVMHYEAQ